MRFHRNPNRNGGLLGFLSEFEGSDQPAGPVCVAVFKQTLYNITGFTRV